MGERVRGGRRMSRGVLKKCPFCGIDPEFRNRGRSVKVVCPNCGANTRLHPVEEMTTDCILKAQIHAAQEWNRMERNGPDE